MATFFVGLNEKIQQKILQAADGDVIMLSAGTYNENLDVYKGVKIYGAGKTNTIIQGSHRTSVVKSATWPLGTTTINLADTSGLDVGRVISGTGIPVNTRIAAINPNVSITLTAATTSARSVATNITMVQQADGTVRVRGGTSSVFAELKDLKIAGYNGISPENPAIEYAAIYFRNTGAGSTAAQYAVLDNCHIEANGEAAILADAAAGVGNITVTNCYISGKTFLGGTPSSGNQYSVANVPRLLVAFQSNNLPITFTNNLIEGVTGGIDANGTPSFNTAVSVDAPNSIITGNIIKGTHGYGYALRARGAGSVVDNNVNYSLTGNTNAGFLIGPTGSQVIGMNVGTNSSITAELVSVEQTAGESFVTFEMSKEVLKQHSAVSSHAVFSNEANWNMVSYVFKHNSSARRLVGSFKDFSSPKKSKLKLNMAIGDTFELHKIILATSSRDLLVLKRSQISGASGFDFNLASDGPEVS